MKIAVLMGGVSREHPISLKSGANITRAFMEGGDSVCPVVIHPNGRWTVPGAFMKPEEFEGFMADPPPGGMPEECVTALRRIGVEVIFPALHGPNGEDGTMQGFLHILGFPFVGSGHLGAALSSDKLVSKALYRDADLPVAPSMVLTATDNPRRGLSFGLPVVLKAPSQGSSFGLAIARTEEQFHDELARLMDIEGRVMVEAFVKGREITCGVLELPDGVLRALPPTEIIPRVSDYFDFEAKYAEGGSDEITPARISEEETSRIQELAVKAHLALRMGGLSRTDFILAGSDLFLLETNALPGFTATSLFPQAAKVAGYSFGEIVRHLANVALGHR